MDSWEFNKIAAAVLAALLIIFGSSTLLELSHGGHGGGDDHGKPGFVLPVSANAGAAAKPGAPAAKGFDPAEVIAKIAKADAKAGEGVFRQCKSCHTVNEGGKNGTGPNLYNIVNRKIASHAGFKFSKALTQKEGNWDYAKLAAFIHKPRAWASGTRMGFGGMPNTDDIASVIAYLRAQSKSPAPLPAAK